MMNIMRKLSVVIVVMGIVFAQSPDALLTDAQAQLETGKVDAAETGFKQVLKIDPTYAPAMVGLAQVYMRKGDMDSTQHYLKKAIEADPENQEFRDEFERLNELNTLMSQGGRSMKNGDMDNAFETFKIALANFPFFAEAAYSMGLVKFRMKDYMASIDHFHKAVALNPQHEKAQTALMNVARVFFSEGNNAYKRRDLEGALAGYNKALSVDDSFYLALYQIGVINSKMGDKDVAIVSYEKALVINPEFYKGWFALGLAKSGLGDVDGAIEALLKAIDLNPGYEKAYGAMGDIYIQKKEYDEAKRVLSIATQVNPGYAKGHANLGVVHLEQNNLDEAIISLSMATTLNKKDAMSFFRLAGIYNQSGECEKAEKAARACTEVKARFGGGWFELGVAKWCGGRGNKTAAINAFERARNDRSWRKLAEYELDRVKNPQKYEN